MQFLRKAPYFLGWLAFYAIAHWMPLLLVLPFRGKGNFHTLSALVISVVLVLALMLLLGFFSFVFSIKIVVTPLVQRNKMVTGEPRPVKTSAYLLRWLAFLFYSLLLCFPLLCRIEGSPLVEDVIPYLWQLVTSYFAYRYVVKEVMQETRADTQLQDGKQVTLA